MSTPQPPDAKGNTAPASGTREAIKLVAALVVIAVAGFSVWRQTWSKSSYKFEPSTLAFVDHAQSNVPLDGGDVGSLQFVNTEGMPVDLQQFRGRKNVVLVVTRGNTTASIPGAYSGNICLYCATQTSRLIANYKAFQEGEAEVVVVFPIKQAAESSQIGQFNEAVKRDGARFDQPPFPLVLDIELRAVDQLGIREDLAKPATYILDKQGQVRFAYVGATIADRPSVQSMLDQLAGINADAR